MFDRFTEEAKSAMVEARTVAVSARSGSIGALELLIACLSVPGSRACACLEHLGVDASSIGVEARKLLRATADQPAVGQVPFNDAAKRVLGLSMKAAADLGHDSLGTDHLLLGVVELGGPPARLVRDHVKDMEALFRSVSRCRKDALGERTGKEWQSATERLAAAIDACTELGEFELAARLHSLVQSLRAKSGPPSD